MPVDQLQQYGPISGAFAAGCLAAWGFLTQILVPAKVKSLQDEINLLRARVKELEDKASKYDALNEKLASAQLAKLQ